jgi:large subunit ribosomal protein L18
MKNVIAVQFARKRSGRTNYKKRLGLLKSNLPRLIVRKTLTSVIVQIVNFAPEGDKVIATSNSKTLKRLGWKHSCKNIPAAYLSGFIVGKMAVEANVKKAIADLGVQSITKGGKILAAVKGAKDAGLDIPMSEDIAPGKETLSGKHIEKADGITQDFEKMKETIDKGEWKVKKEKNENGK